MSSSILINVADGQEPEEVLPHGVTRPVVTDDAAAAGAPPVAIVGDEAVRTRRTSPGEGRDFGPAVQESMVGRLEREVAERSFLIDDQAAGGAAPAPRTRPAQRLDAGVFEAESPAEAIARTWDTDAEEERSIAAQRWIRAGELGSLALVLVAVVAFLGLAVGPHVLHYQLQTMLTGSMAPGIKPGDVVVETQVPATSIRIGDVISYHVPLDDKRVVTHRVVQVVRNADGSVSVRTKGDANPANDPWLAKLDGATAWRVDHTVPFVGTAIRALRHPALSFTLMYVLPTGLVLWAMIAIWRRPAAATAAAGAARSAVRSAVVSRNYSRDAASQAIRDTSGTRGDARGRTARR